MGRCWGSSRSADVELHCAVYMYLRGCTSVWFFFFSSRRRHTRFDCDWSSDVCSSDLSSCNFGTAEIVDDHKRFRLFRSCKRTKPRKRDFLADASLAVTENVGLRLPRDVIAVRESLCGFGNSDGAKRRAGYHFSAVHAAKAKQLHAIA